MVIFKVEDVAASICNPNVEPIFFQLDSSAWQDCCTHEALAMLHRIHLSTILTLIIKNTPWPVTQVQAWHIMHFMEQFSFQGLSSRTRSLVSRLRLKTWGAKVHCQFPFYSLFWNCRGFQRGHCTAIWIIDFNWFNLVLKWAKTHDLSLSEGSQGRAWSSTHL